MNHIKLCRKLLSRLVGVFTLVPVTAFSASFDCTKSSKVVEDIICEAEEISSQDEKMADLYFKIISTANNNDSNELVQTQRSFLLLRNKCHQNSTRKITVNSIFKARDCLLEVYKGRIIELSEWGNRSTRTVSLSSPNETSNSNAKCPKLSESDLVFIPGGTFYMGSSSGAYSDEKPRHKVSVDDFCISKHTLNSKWMSFDDAVRYVKNLSKKYRASFRLVTEAEWEYVASMGTTNNKYKVGELMQDWELTSTIYTKYPYNKNDGRENLYADEVFRVLRGGYPYDPRFDYEPTISLRGYASQDSEYKLRIAADPLD